MFNVFALIVIIALIAQYANADCVVDEAFSGSIVNEEFALPYAVSLEVDADLFKDYTFAITFETDSASTAVTDDISFSGTVSYGTEDIDTVTLSKSVNTLLKKYTMIIGGSSVGLGCNAKTLGASSALVVACSPLTMKHKLPLLAAAMFGTAYSQDSCTHSVTLAVKLPMGVEATLVPSKSNTDAKYYTISTAVPATGAPTTSPTPPTDEPTSSPTMDPTVSPTKNPTTTPTVPTDSPTKNPTANPTKNPTANPTANPTKNPTANPTTTPTANPTKNPTANPTANPTNSPTETQVVALFPLGAQDGDISSGGTIDSKCLAAKPVACSTNVVAFISTASFPISSVRSRLYSNSLVTSLRNVAGTVLCDYDTFMSDAATDDCTNSFTDASLCPTASSIWFGSTALGALNTEDCDGWTNTMEFSGEKGGAGLCSASNPAGMKFISDGPCNFVREVLCACELA